MILLAAVLQAAGVRAPILGRGWVKLDPEHWPVELLPELRQAEREHPEGTRIFNDFLYGGFLIYYTPGLKVFIDDRCELYGDDWLMQFSEAVRSHPERIDRWQETYRFPYALVAQGNGFRSLPGAVSPLVRGETYRRFHPLPVPFLHESRRESRCTRMPFSPEYWTIRRVPWARL